MLTKVRLHKQHAEIIFKGNLGGATQGFNKCCAGTRTESMTDHPCPLLFATPHSTGIDDGSVSMATVSKEFDADRTPHITKPIFHTGPEAAQVTNADSVKQFAASAQILWPCQS